MADETEQSEATEGDEVEVEAGGQLDAGERFFLGDEEFHLRRIAH